MSTDRTSGPAAGRGAGLEGRIPAVPGEWREGLWAVRVFDPPSAARRAFAGIGATVYDPR
ncbi:hypothetical protein [Streptomyces sp. A3M-1-3]|uniref:hypothetical protein n=1 Tax=Streptomyces sp. A3M-1-3 TaxID=2962044 RepID=UPI0035ABC595